MPIRLKSVPAIIDIRLTDVSAHADVTGNGNRTLPILNIHTIFEQTACRHWSITNMIPFICTNEFVLANQLISVLFVGIKITLFYFIIHVFFSCFCFCIFNSVVCNECTTNPSIIRRAALCRSCYLSDVNKFAGIFFQFTGCQCLSWQGNRRKFY